MDEVRGQITKVNSEIRSKGNKRFIGPPLPPQSTISTCEGQFNNSMPSRACSQHCAPGTERAFRAKRWSLTDEANQCGLFCRVQTR